MFLNKDRVLAHGYYMVANLDPESTDEIVTWQTSRKYEEEFFSNDKRWAGVNPSFQGVLKLVDALCSHLSGEIDAWYIPTRKC